MRFANRKILVAWGLAELEILIKLYYRSGCGGLGKRRRKIVYGVRLLSVSMAWQMIGRLAPHLYPMGAVVGKVL